MPSQPTDQPKILIETADGFGGKRVQSTTLDTNRQTPDIEFALGWAELLRMPDSFCDVLLQVGVWAGIGAFTPCVLAALSFPALITYPVALVAAALLIVGGLAAKRNLQHALPLVYRIALIAVGVAIALYDPALLASLGGFTP
jgi:hypothetical protein